MTHGGALAVDLGTSHTVAVLRLGTEPPQPLLFDGSPLLPSAVWVGPELLATGRDARHLAASRPDGYEPHPKARVDEDRVLLGGVEVPTVDLLAAPLARVLAEAVRVAGAPPATTVLTCPAGWGAPRRAVLAEAARRAGFTAPTLVSEPVAAGVYYVTHHPDAGARTVLVYDFGGGTFDVSVIRLTPDGPEVLATDGLPDAGGTDIDEAIVSYLAAVYGPAHPQTWQRLERPVTESDRRARRALWDSARAAKEMLSRAAASYVHLPLLEIEAPLGREQLERLAQPVLNRAVRSCRTALAAAGLTPSDVDAVLLVGGSSRIPLAATLVHRAFGVAPTAVEQPELVVAEGGIFAAESSGVPAVPPATAASDGWPTEPPGTTWPTEPPGTTSSTGPPAPAGRPRHRPLRRAVTLALSAGLVLALGVAAYVLVPRDDGRLAPLARTAPAAASPLPSDPSTQLRAFMRNWLTTKTKCTPALGEFPFADQAVRPLLYETFRCEPLNKAPLGSRLFVARFVSTQARAQFLSGHQLSSVDTKQERMANTSLHIIWFRAATTTSELCLGWFEPMPGLRAEIARQIVDELEF